jgi:Holliday junction resolvasome RuvABC endonuclease subunit
LYDFFGGILREKNDFCVVALDLSLSNTGVAIFDEKGIPFYAFSIPTNSKHSHGVRLKTIADRFYEVKNKYNISVVVLEQGFARWNISTQTLYKVHGVANYIFYDFEQIYYAPSSVKKIVSGCGKTDKGGIMKIVRANFPFLELKNEDESDAVSVGMAYFIDKLGGHYN